MHVCSYVQFIDWAFPPIIGVEIVHLQPSKNTCEHPVFTVTNVLLLYTHVYAVLYFGTSA